MLHIQFQDIKTLIIGNGLGTLGGVFDAYKAPELYIFENYGYHADKVHNIFLEIWYNFGLIGLGIFLYLVRELPSYQKKKSPHFHAIILALFFLFFHFASIVSYLLLIFYIASLAKKHPIPQRKI
ncbi:MAG: O-antigen ligase family protein [Candidatus Peribacteria bacterium]|nr:MAG: O-antigen ligase family protein [Candidatus Peribacteria bacterium]